MHNAVSPTQGSAIADPALTSREAAEILGVSVTTAQMWMEGGMLPSWKTPGGHRRAKKSDVLKLLVNPAAERPVVASDDAQEMARARFVESSILLRDSDPTFDRITWLASELLQAPISLLTFLTSEHQVFKARHGIEMAETPRSWAFCNYAIAQDDVFSVADASKDARFRGNPLVVGTPHIRFYAGVRIMIDDMAFGSLCVIDTEPRILRSHEKRVLHELAAVATEVLRLKMLERARK